MEAERPPTSIKQWYEQATDLDYYLRESQRCCSNYSLEWHS